jgi:biotin operon repressor
MREVAAAVGITERRVAANIADLKAEGLVKVIKREPRNTYRVLRSASLPPSAHGPKTVGEFLDTVEPLVQ